MLFRSKQFDPQSVQLLPFVFKTQDGYLVGMAMDPKKGGPCAGCVELWLKQRNVEIEKANLSDLKIRRDVLVDLMGENRGHVFYEISRDGSTTRLDCAVFPHPECECSRAEYVGPEGLTDRTNYAFSPFVRVESTRFGTPDGNLWLTSATGQCPLAQERVTVYGGGKEKSDSRLQAVEAWLKRAAVADVGLRAGRGEIFSAQILPTEKEEKLTGHILDSTTGTVGVGKNLEEAALDALASLAKMRTLQRYSTQIKNPMLIVGSNNWLRTRVPFFLLQQYDLHLLFYPNSMPSWVVGIAAFSRVRVDERPIFAFGSASQIGKAMDLAVFKILELCRPDDLRIAPTPEVSFDSKKDVRAARISKLNTWWTHWIYRCPKISLKDVLHLEAYPHKLEHWREFFRDGQERVSMLSLNHELLPSAIRSIVRINVPSASVRTSRNVNGIATWADFRDAFA